MMMTKERTTVSLDREDHELLLEVAKENGWPVGDAARRAIHALFALDQHLKAIGDQQEGQVQHLVRRLRRDVDPAFLLRAKPMSKIETDDGSLGIRIDDLTFFDEDGRLFARREVGEEVEVYEARDGRLVLRSTVPSSVEVASLN